MRRLISTIIFISFLCILGSSEFSVVWAKKDTLVMGLESAIKDMDYYKGGTRMNLIAAYQIYDPLVKRDPQTGTLHPNLAISWKTINETTWEFKLRPEVKFHNGNPLTAECIRYTLEDRILPPERKAHLRPQFDWVGKVEVVDDLTFRIITKEPYPLVLEKFNTFFPYDPVWCKEKGEDYVNQNAMGTGPYKFVKFARDQQLVLVANENYWQKGIPKIKNLIIRFIPESSTRMAELLSGGIDVIRNLKPDQVPMIENNPRLKLIETPILRVFYWQFDVAGRASESPLMDVRVRRAFWHAIDRQAIIKNVLGGRVDLLNIPVNPMQFGADPSIEGWKYDPKRAKELLTEAGYAQGLTVECSAYDGTFLNVSEAAAGYLQKVGIDLKIRSYAGNVGQMVDIHKAGNLKGIYAGSFGSYNVFDADAILPWHFNSKISETSYTKDAELEGWLHEARYSVDPKKRKELYAKAQRRVVDQAYWLPWYVNHDLQGADKNLKYFTGVDEVPRFELAEWID
jgi:peptide/nickel transport system substrate-binding protein